MMTTEDNADEITIRDDEHEAECGEDDDNKLLEHSASSKTSWKTCFLFLLVVMAYLFIGAVIFYVLERSDAVQASKNFDAALKRLASENDCVDEADVAKLMDIVTTAIGEGGYAAGHPYAHHLESGTTNESFLSDMWSVTQSFLFTSSVVTTTGFGYTAPRTLYGELFCVLYAIIGIYLTGKIFVASGRLLQNLCLRRITSCLMRNARRLPYSKAAKVLVDIAFVYLMMVTVVSVLYYFTLNWSYVDTHYFTVVMMTTIGFGDLQPVYDLPIIELYVVRIVLFTYLFICIGAVATLIDTITEAQRGGSMEVVQYLSQRKKSLHLGHHQPDETVDDIELETRDVACFLHGDDDEKRVADDGCIAGQSCVSNTEICAAIHQESCVTTTPDPCVTAPERCVNDHV